MNAFALMSQPTLLGLLPIIIQGVLIVLVLTKHEYAKVGLKSWAFIFLCIASGLQLFGRLIQDVAENFENLSASFYLLTGGTIILGVLIVIFTNRTVVVKTTEK